MSGLLKFNKTILGVKYVTHICFQAMMNQLCLVLLGLSVGIICDNREFLPTIGRNAKSLTDTFPFNLQEEDQHHGHDLHQEDDVGLDRGSRQVIESKK